MCFEVDKCCFCVDVTTATRAIALVEATVAAPLVVRGVAELDCSCRGVVLLVAGHVLALSAWALFDGALLRRRGLLAGWLVVTVLKSALLFGMGVLYAFLVDNSDALADISDALGAYFSRCVFSITRHNAGKLFHVVYTIAYFASGCELLTTVCLSVLFMKFFSSQSCTCTASPWSTPFARPSRSPPPPSRLTMRRGSDTALPPPKGDERSPPLPPGVITATATATTAPRLRTRSTKLPSCLPFPRNGTRSNMAARQGSTLTYSTDLTYKYICVRCFPAQR